MINVISVVMITIKVKVVIVINVNVVNFMYAVNVLTDFLNHPSLKFKRYFASHAQKLFTVGIILLNLYNIF